MAITYLFMTGDKITTAQGIKCVHPQGEKAMWQSIKAKHTIIIDKKTYLIVKSHLRRNAYRQNNRTVVEYDTIITLRNLDNWNDWMEVDATTIPKSEVSYA